VNRFHEKTGEPYRGGRVITRLLLLLVLVLVSHSAAEAQRCWVRSNSPVNFGEYDPLLTGDLDATGVLQFRCNRGSDLIVKIDAGTGGSFAPRTMQGPLDQLAYNLYLDAARTTVWGDGTGGTGVAYFYNVSRWTTAAVYGRTPLGQDVGVGIYTDTVVMTVEW
jgi:spore coat protein U-like protein